MEEEELLDPLEKFQIEITNDLNNLLLSSEQQNLSVHFHKEIDKS